MPTNYHSGTDRNYLGSKSRCRDGADRDVITRHSNLEPYRRRGERLDRWIARRRATPRVDNSAALYAHTDIWHRGDP